MQHIVHVALESVMSCLAWSTFTAKQETSSKRGIHVVLIAGLCFFSVLFFYHMTSTNMNEYIYIYRRAGL